MWMRRCASTLQTRSPSTDESDAGVARSSWLAKLGFIAGFLPWIMPIVLVVYGVKFTEHYPDRASKQADRRLTPMAR